MDMSRSKVLMEIAADLDSGMRLTEATAKQGRPSPDQLAEWAKKCALSAGLLEHARRLGIKRRQEAAECEASRRRLEKLGETMQRMSGEDFAAWIEEMVSTGRVPAQADALILLGVSPNNATVMKQRGTKRSVALACAALLAGLEPYRRA